MYLNINVLEGKVISNIVGLEEGSDYILFYTECGKVYKMFHEQDCCEDVRLNDFEGEFEDVVGGLVVCAEERCSSEGDRPNEYSESYTWTFYDIQTTKGSLWLRWLGESNGYYSEDVRFVNG